MMNDEREPQQSERSYREEELERRDDSGKPQEIISLDVGEEGEYSPGLDEETTLELLRDAQEEEYEDEIRHYTDDESIQESFSERQELNTGRGELRERLDEHHATSPELSGGDIDAAWEDADVGEETVGGMAPTPDQDQVDEIGEAYGVTYEDDEPLRTADKLEERDEERWELDPDSAEEQ